jgi:hypothetical protein
MRNYRCIVLSLTLGIATAAVLASATQARAEDPVGPLVSGQNGKCLQPINGSTKQGDAIVQETCNGSAAQQWTVHDISSTQVHLINRANGLCLDARGKAVNGTPIQQWPCNWISNEKWGFGIKNNTLSSAIYNSVFTHCVATLASQNGAPVQLSACSGDISQVWTHAIGPINSPASHH